MLINYKNIIPLLWIIIPLNCSSPQIDKNPGSIINTSHLDFLYEDIEVEGKQMGIIHIYSNFPEYKWIGDDDEGISCVDDAARAAVLYLRYNQIAGDSESLRKGKNLLVFLMHMQAENGFFYNFIWEDHSINKDFKTSVAEPNWWSWRALWALTEGYNLFKNNDETFSKKIISTVEKTIASIKKNIPEEYKTKNIDGFILPTWLPYETASDQAAVLLLGLSNYYRYTKDEIIINYIKKLSEGIILMQEGASDSFPYGSFMSWENLWHGWGNLQSYALLVLYDLVKEEPLKNAALKEVNNFYDYLIGQNYLNEFIIERSGDKINQVESKKFSQIAYIIRPMIYACLQAYKVTMDTLYINKAVEISGWFFGKNPAQKQMYFPESGKCFDGINNENELNKNSGAESTIEALLALLEIETNPAAKELFNKKMEIYFEESENK